MFKTIKRWLFGEDTVEDICKGVVKDKKLSPEQKMSTIISNYKQYFSGKFHQDVNMATYEIHYEEFMPPNGQRNEIRYKVCYNEEKNNMAFCQIAMLSKFYKKLTEQNLDKQQLSDHENRVLVILDLFDHEFAKVDYDGTLFYTNIEVQTNLLKMTYHAINTIAPQDEQQKAHPQDEPQTLPDDGQGCEM